METLGSGFENLVGVTIEQGHREPCAQSQTQKLAYARCACQVADNTFITVDMVSRATLSSRHIYSV